MAGETGKRYAPFFSESNIFFLLKIELVYSYMSTEQTATSVALNRIVSHITYVMTKTNC